MIVSLIAGALLLGPPALDDASMAVVKASWKKLAGQASVSGTAVQTSGGRSTTYKFKLSRPNLMNVMSKDVEYHSNGSDMYFYMTANKQYQKMVARNEGQVLMLLGFEPVMGAKLPEVKSAVSAKFAGRDAVKAVLPGGGQVTQALYIDKKTKLPLGWTQTYSGQTMEFRYSDVKLGGKLDTSMFAWAPPSGATEYKQPDFTESLLKEGAEAPDFANETPVGGKMGLNETLGKSKAVLLNFWFYG